MATSLCPRQHLERAPLGDGSAVWTTPFFFFLTLGGEICRRRNGNYERGDVRNTSENMSRGAGVLDMNGRNIRDQADMAHGDGRRCRSGRSCWCQVGWSHQRREERPQRGEPPAQPTGICCLLLLDLHGPGSLAASSRGILQGSLGKPFEEAALKAAAPEPLGHQTGLLIRADGWRSRPTASG